MAYKKCVICNEKIIGETGVPYKERFAHQHCFNIAVKTLQQKKNETLQQRNKTKSKSKPKTELKNGLSEEEYQAKTLLYSYLKELLMEDTLSAKIYAILNDFIKRYEFTYQGMYTTLVYLYEYKNKEVSGDVIGIIPYYYSEAENFFSSVVELNKQNENKDINQMYKQKVYQMNIKTKKNKLIDITSI